MKVSTRLQQIRKTRGLSAADLAHRVGVSRQTIYAIEEGSFVPNTTVSLQLAQVLDVTVEELFSIAKELSSEPIPATLLSSDPGQGRLVRLCRSGKQLVAVPVSAVPAYLPLADGIIESRSRRSVSIKSATVPDEGKRLLLAGCDPALSLISESLHGSGIDIVTIPCASRSALEWLKQGKIHAAGSHLLDHATGDYNVPIIRRLLPNRLVRVVTFAVWEQGLLLRHGNPKAIHSLADLARRDVRVMNREKGSGTRDLLDTGLRRLGISPKDVQGYSSIARGHLAAAYAVASGTADCCIAPSSAARCFGLDFVPLALERFDLTFTRRSLELPAVKAVLDLLNRSDLRRKLQSIAGYDTAHTGRVLV